jgi:hypothetical protein
MRAFLKRALVWAGMCGYLPAPFVGWVLNRLGLRDA